jgi:hypothetical protein
LRGSGIVEVPNPNDGQIIRLKIDAVSKTSPESRNQVGVRFTILLHDGHTCMIFAIYTGENSQKGNLHMKTKQLLVFSLVLFLFTSACRANFSRNNDGTLTAETTISQEELQETINDSIADPLITELNVTLQSGYATVTGQRQRLNDASKTDSLSFRLDLGVSNGKLTATISNALLDDHALEQSRLDRWNETIANRISRAGAKNSNSSLQTVNITPDAVTLTWLVSQ